MEFLSWKVSLKILNSEKPEKLSPINGPRREKTFLREFANNTGADQPAHTRRLISPFVIPLSRSIIYRLATRKNLIF